MASEEVINFASTGDAVPVNVAESGTHAYFISKEALGGLNPEGAEAQAGEQNLYLSEEGAISFVATVTDRDVDGEVPPLEADPADGLGLWTEDAGSQPAKDPSRTNPDGSVFLFQSRANITGYPESKFPQIYRYDSVAGALQCISCIPTKTLAKAGRARELHLRPYFNAKSLHPIRLCPQPDPRGYACLLRLHRSAGLHRLGWVSDVYEWEANGVGSCKQAGGCVYLISTGQSERPNFLYGHSTDGRDVFFTTADTLTGWDSAAGSFSIYDARVGGGFPGPLSPTSAADGCRPSITPVPVFEMPRAGGDGDIRQLKSCPKGKRKVKQNGKVRCVKSTKARAVKPRSEPVPPGGGQVRNASIKGKEMKCVKMLVVLVVASIALMALASPVSAAEEFSKYDIESVSASLSDKQAGAHADMTSPSA